MRLVILFALATSLALVAQTIVPLWLPLRGLVPNLVVILAVDLGLRHQGALAAVIAFAMGYATDVFSGTRLGLNAFVVTLVFLITHAVGSRLLVTNALVGAVLVFLGVIVAGAGGMALGSGRAALDNVSAVLPSIFLQAVVSSVIAPVMFALLAAGKRALKLSAKPQRE